jgi:hypothetical protein
MATALGTTRTSGMGIEEDILQIKDQDLIGTDERYTSTEDFEEYLLKKFGKRFRVKEV